MGTYEDKFVAHGGLADFETSGSTLTVNAGVRAIPGGQLFIPAASISFTGGFADITETSTAAGWKYFYVSISDSTQFAASSNSPYDKNGGVSNIVTISSTKWVYLGCNYWNGGSFITMYSQKNEIFFRHEVINTHNNGGRGWRIINGSTSTVTQTNIFNSFLPGQSTNRLSRVASMAIFCIAANSKHRSDGGTQVASSVTCNFFDQNHYFSRQNYIKTPQGGLYYPQDGQFFKVEIDTSIGTDTVSGSQAPNSAVGDGDTEFRIGIVKYRDRYIY